MSLTETGFRVTDPERLLGFHVGGLGRVEKGRGEVSHGGRCVGRKDPDSGVELELNHYPPATRFAIPVDGLDHLGSGVADARAAIERRRAGGQKVAVEPWPEQGMCWIGFVEDPEGPRAKIGNPVAGAEREVDRPVSGP